MVACTRRPVLTMVFVGRVSSTDLNAVKLMRCDSFAASVTTMGLPPLKLGLAGCEMVTVDARPVDETNRKSGSPPGLLCKSVISGGANQKSVPLCANVLLLVQMVHVSMMRDRKRVKFGSMQSQFGPLLTKVCCNKFRRMC